MSFLDGDGRRMLEPPTGYEGRPLRMRRASARRVISAYRQRADGLHISPTGGTLWVVAEWLKEQGLKFTLEERDGCFLLRRINP